VLGQLKVMHVLAMFVQAGDPKQMIVKRKRHGHPAGNRQIWLSFAVQQQGLGWYAGRRQSCGPKGTCQCQGVPRTRWR
jgi:hypothetical protein